MTDALKKLDDIRSKITDLKLQEKQIQESLATELVKVLEEADVLTMDFKTLVGGILHVQDTTKTNSQQAEAWQQAGEKFLKKRIKGRKEQPPRSSKKATGGESKRSANPINTDQNLDQAAA